MERVVVVQGIMLWSAALLKARGRVYCGSIGTIVGIARCPQQRPTKVLRNPTGGAETKCPLWAKSEESFRDALQPILKYAPLQPWIFECKVEALTLDALSGMPKGIEIDVSSIYSLWVSNRT